jgi:hypothetical protein
MRTAGMLSAAAWTTPLAIRTWSAANAPAARTGHSTSERVVAHFIEDAPFRDRFGSVRFGSILARRLAF